jgi:hypothetical protein
MAIALLTLALVGTLGLCGAILIGYRVPGDAALMRSHFVLALVTTMVLVMAHSFIMFFLIATGVELKDMERDRGWGDSFRRRTVAFKSRVFPIVSLALLLIMANFILGAAAHTRALPAWLHEGLAWTTLLACAFTLHREYRVLGDNNKLIDEAARRRRGEGAIAGGPRPDDR